MIILVYSGRVTYETTKLFYMRLHYLIPDSSIDLTPCTTLLGSALVRVAAYESRLISEPVPCCSLRFRWPSSPVLGVVLLQVDASYGRALWWNLGSGEVVGYG